MSGCTSDFIQNNGDDLLISDTDTERTHTHTHALNYGPFVVLLQGDDVVDVVEEFQLQVSLSHTLSPSLSAKMMHINLPDSVTSLVRVAFPANEIAIRERYAFDAADHPQRWEREC